MSSPTPPLEIEDGGTYLAMLQVAPDSPALVEASGIAKDLRFRAERVQKWVAENLNTPKLSPLSRFKNLIDVNGQELQAPNAQGGTFRGYGHLREISVGESTFRVFVLVSAECKQTFAAASDKLQRMDKSEAHRLSNEELLERLVPIDFGNDPRNLEVRQSKWTFAQLLDGTAKEAAKETTEVEHSFDQPVRNKLSMAQMQLIAQRKEAADNLHLFLLNVDGGPRDNAWQREKRELLGAKVDIDQKLADSIMETRTSDGGPQFPNYVACFQTRDGKVRAGKSLICDVVQFQHDNNLDFSEGVFGDGVEAQSTNTRHKNLFRAQGRLVSETMKFQVKNGIEKGTALGSSVVHDQKFFSKSDLLMTMQTSRDTQGCVQ